MRIAIIGPPFSGKSTVFSALSTAAAEHSAARPDQPVVATVAVPDNRLDWIAGHFKPARTVHAVLEFVDLPGIELDSHAGREHALRLFPVMREADALLAVVRAFHSEQVPAYRDRVDPLADLEELRLELAFADLDLVCRRIEKLQKAVTKPTAHQQQDRAELELMQRCRDALEAERPLSSVQMSAEQQRMLRSFAFLTLRPMCALINVDESRIADEPPQLGPPFESVVVACALIERDLSQLSAQERPVFMKEYGLAELLRERLLRQCYRMLGLRTFFTHNPKEARAWTVRAGTTALDAAGMVHSDFARGFIRAEVVSFDDLQAAGDTKSARTAGKVRLEGKSYEIQDGDVVFFKVAL